MYDVGRAASYNGPGRFFPSFEFRYLLRVVDTGASARLHPRGGRFLLIGR